MQCQTISIPKGSGGKGGGGGGGGCNLVVIIIFFLAGGCNFFWDVLIKLLPKLIVTVHSKSCC